MILIIAENKSNGTKHIFLTLIYLILNTSNNLTISWINHTIVIWNRANNNCAIVELRNCVFFLANII